MEVKLSSGQFAVAVQSLSSFVERRSPHAATSMMLFQPEDSRLLVTGTDLEIEQTSFLPCESITAPTACLLPAHRLMEVCRAIPPNIELNMKCVDDKVTLEGSRFHYKLQSFSTDEFPRIEADEKAATFSLPQAEFKQLFEKTAFSMAVNDVRYYLNSTMLTFEDDALCAVSTDGHRLALCKMKLAEPPSAVKETGAILSRKLVLGLKNQLRDSDDPVEISLGEKQVGIRTDRFHILAKLVEGKYPEYQRVFPSELKYACQIPRDDFVRALRRMLAISSGDAGATQFSFKKDELQLHATNQEQEEAYSSLPVAHTGGDLKVGFNARYFMEIAETLDSEKITVEARDDSSAALIRAADSEECRYLIMPMRL